MQAGEGAQRQTPDLRPFGSRADTLLFAGGFQLNPSLYLLPSIFVVQSRRMISITVSVVRSR